MNKLLVILSLILSFSALADNVANMECQFTYGGGISWNKAVKDQEGYWDIVFSNCLDGQKKYQLTFSQNKIINFDFLKNKARSEGIIKLNCIGTDVNGTYHGINIGLAVVLGVETGTYISLLGNQAICTLLEFEATAFGFDVSPQKLIIQEVL
jgi:hypothetical protein